MPKCRLIVFKHYTHNTTRWQKTHISDINALRQHATSLHPHDCISFESEHMNQEDQSTSPSSVKQAHSVCHCPWLKSHHWALRYLCKRRRGREVCVGRNDDPFHIARFGLWHLGLDVNSSPVQSHIMMMRQIRYLTQAASPPSQRPPSSPTGLTGSYRLPCQGGTGVGMDVFM